MPVERLVSRHRVLTWTAGAGGPPLLLLHGFLGRAESWSAVVQRFGADLDVAAVDLPGHGPITPVGAALRFEDVADTLADVARRLDTRPWHVSGYSLGARLALAMSVRAPELCRGATLVGVNPGLADPEEREERAAGDERWAALLRDRGLAAFLEAWEAQPLFASQARLAEEVRAAQRALRRTHDANRLALALRATGLATMPDYWPALARIPFPVRLVAGALDGRFVEIARRAASRLPRGTLAVVPGSGHNVPLEDPRAMASLLERG